MDDRVWVGTCAGPRDILLVRSLFNAYDIPVVISGQHHFSLFPWYMGAFRTDVFAGVADAARAAALLADSRRGERVAPEDASSPRSTTGHPGLAPVAQPIDSPPDIGSIVATDWWQQAGIALLFGMITGFGAAHFYDTRAWVRGLALALVQLSASKLLGHSKEALGLVVVARIVDVVGALWLVRYGRDEQVAFRRQQVDTAPRGMDSTGLQDEAPSAGADQSPQIAVADDASPTVGEVPSG